MRAVLTAGHGERDCLICTSDHPTPEPGKGEVVVKVAYTALNFHDIFTRRGMPGITVPLPIVVGSDISGEVASVGVGVEGWNAGDRVMIDPYCRTMGKIGLVGEVADGGRAEYVKVSADQLIRIPADVSLRQAACVPMAYGTALRMLEKGQLRPGEKVLILGASGGVGVACVQLAKMAGAEVIACASSPDKIECLKAIGADHVINYARTNFAEEVKKICGKPRAFGQGGVDVAINFTGGETWIDTQKSVGHGGRILSCGSTAGFTVQMDTRYFWTFEHRYLGSSGWSRANLVELLDMAAAKRLDPVVHAVMALEEAAEAERLLEERAVFGKLLLQP